MIDDGMVWVQKILSQQIYSHLITNQYNLLIIQTDLEKIKGLSIKIKVNKGFSAKLKVLKDSNQNKGF